MPHTLETNQTVSARRPVAYCSVAASVGHSSDCVLTVFWLQWPSLAGGRSGKSQKLFLQGPHLPNQSSRYHFIPEGTESVRHDNHRQEKERLQNHSFAKRRSTRGHSKARTQLSNAAKWPFLMCRESFAQSRPLEVWIHCQSWNKNQQQNKHTQTCKWNCTPGHRSFTCPNCQSEFSEND